MRGFLTLTLGIFILWLLTGCNSEPTPISGVTTNSDSTHFVYLTFDNGPFDSSGLIDKYLQVDRLPVTIFIHSGRVAAFDTLLHYVKLYRNNDFITVGRHPANEPTPTVDSLVTPNNPQRLLNCNYWQLGNRRQGSCDTTTTTPPSGRIYGWDLSWQLNPDTRSPVLTAQELFNQIQERLRSGGTFTPNHLVLRVDGEFFNQTWEDSPLSDLVHNLRKDPHIQLRGLNEYPTPGTETGVRSEE